MMAAVATAAFAACKEDVVAPGSCPTLCPSNAVQLVDTSLSGVIQGDTSFRGFYRTQDAPIMLAANLPSYQAIPIAKFFTRPSFWIADTDTVRLGRIDSVKITVQLTNRDTTVHNLRILIYKVPIDSVDSNATYASIAPLVSPANLVDSILVDDSVTLHSYVHVLPAGAFEPDTTNAPDSSRVAAVLAVHADSATSATFAATELTGAPLRLEWFARGVDTTKTQTLTSTPEFDSFVQNPPAPDAVANTLFAGGLPGGRTIIRFNIPRYFIDSTTIVKGTLELTPSGPILGLPHDSAGLIAYAVVRDYGPKSFYLTTAGFSGGVMVRQGDTSTVKLDLTSILTAWKSISADSLPRDIILLSAREGASVIESRFNSSTAASGKPVLHLTYVKPYTFGVP